MRREPRGQVLVLVAILITILLAAAGLTIDLGRQNAERRHVQTAADAAALAACRALIYGDSDASAAAAARTIALVNIEGSPAGADATIAADIARVYQDGHAGDPSYLRSGIIVSGTSVRVAIASTMETTLARVVGITTLDTGARAHCQLSGGPAVPIAARRYISAPGPGNGFIDYVATEATSTLGQVDLNDVLGFDIRTPATESVPGPEFSLYGPRSKSSNDRDFRGFIGLDVRNFSSDTSRIYYNGVPSGINNNTLKTKEGLYLLTGYPGPGFPPVITPPDPNDQIAALVGNDTAMIVSNFSQVYGVGDRILLAVYNGTVMAIPDFAIAPPSLITLASTTGSAVNGPSFSVTRNAAFSSTVTLHLHGDEDAAAAGFPAYNILPTPPVSPPAAGHMNQPTWSTDVFVPAKNGTTVKMSGILTNAIPAGIYMVWLEGHSGNPYFQARRYAVPVAIGGAVRDFSLINSTWGGSTPTIGGSISLPIYVSTSTASSTKWGSSGSAVAVSWDPASFTNCTFTSASIGPGQITFSSSSVTPSSSGSGALSTMTISTVGLAPGCYRFNVRATGINGSGQPVTHIQSAVINVASESSTGTYVDIIGFEVFKVTDLNANEILGRAVSGVYADPNDPNLRRAQRARLIPWS
jgi:Flp pilus assembly protein TadG